MRRRVIVIGVALLLLVVSRLPYLLGGADWGVFLTEHLWLITDPAAVDSWLDGARRADTLGRFDPPLYATHYHGGGRAVAEAVWSVGQLTGDFGLLQLKLVGLLASAVALAAWLAAVMMVWPEERARWSLSVFVAWLAPPTLLLWQTLMPMGHYMETWFFHAVFLVPLVLVLQDRVGPVFLGVIGLAAGLAMTYVVSNVIFPLLIGLLFLLVSRRSIAVRIAGAGALLASCWLSWTWLAGARLAAGAERIGSLGAEQETLGLLLERVLETWLASPPGTPS